MKRLITRVTLVVFLLLASTLVATCSDDVRIGAFNIRVFGRTKVANAQVLNILVQVFFHQTPYNLIYYFTADLNLTRKCVDPMAITMCGSHCNKRRSLPSQIVSAQPFPDRPRPMSCKSPSYDWNQRQTIIAYMWSTRAHSTKFEGGPKLLHEADDDAVIWLESTATTRLAK